MVSARGVHVQAKPGGLPEGNKRSARWLNAAVHTLTHPSAKLSRPEAAEADADSNVETTPEPAAAPLVPAEQAAETQPRRPTRCAGRLPSARPACSPDRRRLRKPRRAQRRRGSVLVA
jgi:hypothetical protein